MQITSLLKKLKVKLKQAVCDHKGYEAEFIENPSPCHFLDVRAKCSDCGATSYEILKRATDNYKINLADAVLFQRNINKFSGFYEAVSNSMQVRKED